MKVAIVSSRQLQVFKRMDAGFNIWLHQLVVQGLQEGSMENFWQWFDETRLKRSVLEETLLEATDLADAVARFERYMSIRYVPGIKELIPNWETSLRQFVLRLVSDLIVKKQTEAAEALHQVARLKDKFKCQK